MNAIPELIYWHIDHKVELNSLIVPDFCLKKVCLTKNLGENFTRKLPMAAHVFKLETKILTKICQFLPKNVKNRKTGEQICCTQLISPKKWRKWIKKISGKNYKIKCTQIKPHKKKVFKSSTSPDGFIGGKLNLNSLLFGTKISSFT